MGLTKLAAVVATVTFLGGPCSLVAAGYQPAGEAASAGKVDLRPRFRAGQEIRYVMELDINSTRADQVQKIEQEIGLLLRVKDTSPESGSNLELVYESLKLTSGGALGGIEFDSTQARPKDKSEAAIYDLLSPVVGLALAVKMDKDGNISSVSGGSGLAAHVGAQFTGADGIKGLLGPITSMNKSPGKLSVGDSWHNKDTMEAPLGTMQIDTTHTLKSHKASDAEIDIKGTVTLTPSAAAGPQVAIKDSGITGTAHWDTEVGLLKSLQTIQRFSTEQVEGDQTVKSTQEMTVKVTRK